MSIYYVPKSKDVLEHLIIKNKAEYLILINNISMTPISGNDSKRKTLTIMSTDSWSISNSTIQVDDNNKEYLYKFIGYIFEKEIVWEN